MTDCLPVQRLKTKKNMDQTKASALSNTGLSQAGEEAESEWDALGGKKVLYPNGSTCSYFKKDGRFVHGSHGPNEPLHGYDKRDTP